MQQSPRSCPLALPLLSGTGFSVNLLTSNAESCDEDGGEVGEGVVEEELADKPGTTNGTQLEILQPILLPFLMGCGFLTAFPVIRVPMFFAQFPQGKHCRSFFKKHNFHQLNPFV